MLDRVPPARHVRIAVPAYTGQISVQTAHSLCGALPLIQQAGLNVDTDFMAGCCYLDHTRNILADRFMQSSATDMIFVDADVGFAAESMLELIAATRPLVAGIYPKKSDDPAWPVAVDAPEIWSDKDGLVECAMVPTGFMRINRGVFEALREHVPLYKDPVHGLLRAYFQTVTREGLYVGEDVEFCNRWRALGGKVHAFADMDFGHVGTREWRGSWGAWLKSRAKETP